MSDSKPATERINESLGEAWDATKEKAKQFTGQEDEVDRTSRQMREKKDELKGDTRDIANKGLAKMKDTKDALAGDTSRQQRYEGDASDKPITTRMNEALGGAVDSLRSAMGGVETHKPLTAQVSEAASGATESVRGAFGQEDEVDRTSRELRGKKEELKGDARDAANKGIAKARDTADALSGDTSRQSRYD